MESKHSMRTRASAKKKMVYDMGYHPADDVLRPAASKARKAAHAREVTTTQAMDVERPEENLPSSTASTQTEEGPAQLSDHVQAADGEASGAENPPANDNTQQSNQGNQTAQASLQTSATSLSSQITVASQGGQPVIKWHASSKRHHTDLYPGPREPHDPQWHHVSSRAWQRTVGFEGNPAITWGALNQWAQMQGHLQTLGVWEIEAPTVSLRVKYRHHRALVELMAKQLEDVEGVDDLGD
ncbi:MAG: hypothetical protein Q9184_006572 [Pyrenodesmia sp. 2 TL-2023]